MAKYSKTITAKKSVFNGVWLGLVGGLVTEYLPLLQDLPAELKVGKLAVVILLLTGVANWFKHRNDK